MPGCVAWPDSELGQLGSAVPGPGSHDSALLGLPMRGRAPARSAVAGSGPRRAPVGSRLLDRRRGWAPRVAAGEWGSPTTCPWFDLRLRPAACAVRLPPVIGYGHAGTGGSSGRCGPGRSDVDGPGRRGWHTGGEWVIRRWSATRGWWDGRGRRSEAGTGSVLPVADHAVGPFAGLASRSAAIRMACWRWVGGCGRSTVTGACVRQRRPGCWWCCRAGSRVSR